jgi:hypothetical protein
VQILELARAVLGEQEVLVVPERQEIIMVVKVVKEGTVL